MTTRSDLRLLACVVLLTGTALVAACGSNYTTTTTTQRTHN
jgi:hypothetical protein